MRFFVGEITQEKVLVMARAESENGTMIGDLVRDVHPGEFFFGLGYGRLTELGLGEHDLDEVLSK